MVAGSAWLPHGGVGAVQVSRGGFTVAPQAPSAADMSAIASAQAEVALAAASFNATDCYTSQASAACYPPSVGVPPPEPWDAWMTWAQTIVDYAQRALVAAQSAESAALRIAAVNQAAYYAAQSVSSSVGSARQILTTGVQPMLVKQGWVWESSDGSTGQYISAASWKYSKQGTYNFYPNPTFISAISNVLSYCQGAVSYAQQAAQLASAATPTPSPLSSFQRVTVREATMRGAGAVQSHGNEAPKTSSVSTCENWSLGTTVTVGQTEFTLAEQQWIPLVALQVAARGHVLEPVTYFVGGGWFHFQPVSNGRVAIYYCSREPVRVAHPEGLGQNGGPTPAGTPSVTPAGTTPNASPAASQPPTTTGGSNAATASIVTGSLIATAVVFTVVAWAVEGALNKAFKSGDKKK
jgi:hypothetical protein